MLTFASLSFHSIALCNLVIWQPPSSSIIVKMGDSDFFSHLTNEYKTLRAEPDPVKFNADPEPKYYPNAM